MDTEEIRKLSALARLAVTDDELKGLSKDLNSILEYVSAIRSVSTEFPDQVTGDARGRVNIFRDYRDREESALYTEALLEEVPERDRDWVKVKKIIGGRE